MSHKKKRRLISQFISALLIVGFLVGLMPMLANAAMVNTNDEYFEITGNDTGRFKLESNRSKIFHADNIGPGDKWGGTIHVTNKASATMEIAVVSVTSDQEDNKLFDILATDMMIDNKLIYSGTYGFDKEDEYMTSFYTIKPGKTLKIDTSILFPIEAGNEYMDATMDSTWTFEARYYGEEDNEYPYRVYYLDQEGNELLPYKYGLAEYGTKIKEYAPEIEGYTPDAEMKELKIKATTNKIVFIYSPVKEDVPPTDSPDPDEPTTSEPSTEPTSKPDKPNKPADTGYDWIDETTGSLAWILIAILSIACTLIIYKRIKNIKKDN